MDERFYYQLIADGLLILHFLFIAFVVIGFALILAGILKKWNLARNFWFRSVHLLAIVIVVLQAWYGIVCPLTTWEMHFRARAGEIIYTGSFIEHWLHQIMFFQAQSWVFTLCYSLFGLAVLASWLLYPPHFRNSAGSN
jgi:hypothetical protein